MVPNVCSPAPLKRTSRLILEWNAITPSECPLRDVAGILATQGDRLDFSYLQKWAEHLGVSEQLKKLTPD